MGLRALRLTSAWHSWHNSRRQKQGISCPNESLRVRHKGCARNPSPMSAYQSSFWATRAFRTTWATVMGVHMFAACGGETADYPTRSATGGGGAVAGTSVGGQASSGSSGVQRTPTNHRAASSTCPAQRGPNCVSVDGCQNDSAVNNGSYVSCTQDSDCTTGRNGRCFEEGPMACMTDCTYDTCFSDSDCPNSQPCECRQTDSDSAANTCETGGNCRIDADCGQGGYCSLSQVNNSCFCPSSALCPSGTCCSPGPCVCGDSCGHG
jgi:hypothetical protein